LREENLHQPVHSDVGQRVAVFRHRRRTVEGQRDRPDDGRQRTRLMHVHLIVILPFDKQHLAARVRLLEFHVHAKRPIAELHEDPLCQEFPFDAFPLD